MPLLEAKSLCKHYRAGTPAEVRAVDGVSLHAERGSFTVLTGPSGSGKTTLLALLGALDRPTSGQVLFDGQDLSAGSDVALTRMRRRFGFVFQDFALIPHLSAADNVTYPLIPRGLTRGDRNDRAQELLIRFGMGSRLDERAGALSGGEQQRVALARALAGDPEILFADEPTSNLDPDTSQLVITTFAEFHAAGKTVIACTHDPQLRGLATRVLELERGRLRTDAAAS